MTTTSSGTFGQKLSRDDWRKKKELEEARKAGTAPAEVDEEGRDINPHIPQYIAQAPWYVSTGRPTLKHQRPQEEHEKKFDGLTDWYKRGITKGPAATKFRKGACENCGSMTHKKKDCLERPRRIGAKFNNKDIKPDEVVQPDLSLSFDGKRDRWNGYNPDEHRTIIEEYSKLELAKRHLKDEKLQAELASGQLSEETVNKTEEDKDDDKYADEVDMPGTKFDSKTRITVRNLRIREDTAKYLYNLDPNSAFYDSKTRSMRENPFSHMNKDPSELEYAGDNFVRHTGDAREFAKSQMFAWEAVEHETDIHPQAEPTQLTLMHREFQNKKDGFKKDLQQSILDKYGGEEHLEIPAKELLLAQTEHYVEYSRLGNVIKGQEKAVAKSRYEENVFINNHTSVWGSYWEDGQWGYACCHSFIKGSYCTGESGKLARKTSRVSRLDITKDDDETDEERIREFKMASKKAKTDLQSDKEDDEKERERKVRKAMKREKERENEIEEIMKLDEKKRPYNSMKAEGGTMPTEEEMEAYYRRKRRKDDPMSAFL